jgi:uncharacterized protein YdiU (UPF0061 family)
MTSSNKKLNKTSLKKTYSKFSKLDGRHSLKNVTDECYVDYQARVRHGGKVVVFNYDLAREMGLVAKNHEDQMNSDLEKSIIDAFALVIINEYDKENNIKFPLKDIKSGHYMATRYLQLQHPNKQGKTSGDGRSIWNGEIKHQGKTWDVSSCGTGATILSPATHIQGRLFQTGDPTISYGCGYSEVDEGIETLFFSEVLQLNQLTTERVLAIIQFPDGYGITVRAHDNLMRPSHFFNHLKQNNLEPLKSLVDYFIDRQVANSCWKIAQSKNKYDYFLDKQIEVFAKIAADFEDEYIFCWLDWDGDNILMDGGIIDYGSVRQFGLFHHEYRFDDDDRYSTTILEQKKKAKYIIQCFIQIVDYIKTGDKKSISHFNKSSALTLFESMFSERKKENILRKVGFDPSLHHYLIKNHSDEIESFAKAFSYFERAKSHRGMRTVNDGISWDAIFCMRDILRELPQLHLSRGEFIKDQEFIEILKSSYAKPKDLELTPYRKRKIRDFQKSYHKLVEVVSAHSKTSLSQTLLSVTMRSSVINRFDRVTGDSISTIRIMVMEKLKTLTPDRLYKLAKNFATYQNLDPENEYDQDDQLKKGKTRSQIFKGFVEIVREYREGL